MHAFLASGSDPTAQSSCQNVLFLMIQIHSIRSSIDTNVELTTTTLEGVSYDATVRNVTCHLCPLSREQIPIFMARIAVT